MIKRVVFVLSILAIVICLPIYGQSFSKEYGEIGRAEFELKQYAPDRDAEAVVLFDIGKSWFEGKEKGRQVGFDIIFERKTRIKVLSESGLKWAEIQIPYYQLGTIYERIYDVEAYAYNFEDGKIKKTVLDASNTFDEKISNNWILKKFAIPNVKVGTIIEYKYKIKSPYLLNLRDWEFQWKIPVVFSEYEVRMTPYYDYVYLLQGAAKFDSYRSNTSNRERKYGPYQFREQIYNFGMTDVPAFKGEEFITSVRDYIIKIDFQLAKISYLSGGYKEVITTWVKMNDHLLKLNEFGRYINRSEILAKNLIDVNNIKLKTEEEKFNFVLDYVKNNYKWNRFNDKLASKTANNFVKEMHGNSADINLFTIGMLKSVGIDAKPVLISTRKNGKIKYDYPFLDYFNYVGILANVGGASVMTDATDILNLNNRIPVRSFNDSGLIVEKNKAAWLGLEFQILSEINNHIEIEVINKELMVSSISKQATEYDALNYRSNLGGNRNAIAKNLADNNFDVIESSIEIVNQQDIKEPYVLSYKQTSKPTILEDKIYISPFLNLSLTDNPLKEETRTYPIDMIYPTKRSFATTIIIPEGYQVEYIPEEQTIKNQLVELTYKITPEKGKLKVYFDYAFNKAIYPTNIYPQIKRFFEEIVKKGNEEIVLSKKS